MTDLEEREEKAHQKTPERLETEEGQQLTYNALRYINNKSVIDPQIDKPCRQLKYCPYGSLVELFPLGKDRTELSCRVFGHDCPVHYHREHITEG